MKNLEQKFAPFFNQLSYNVLNYRPAFFGKTQDRRNWYSNRFFNLKWKLSKDVIEKGILGGLASLNSVFKVKQRPSIEPNGNPFHFDLYSMGTYLGQNDEICVMYDSHAQYVKIVHRPSGQVLMVEIKQEVKE
jgi:hypothetical protein